MGELRTEARFPRIARGRGHYESFFIRTFHPAEPLGAWIRYTVLKRPGAEPRGSLWFTLFEADGPTASKATFGPGELTPSAYIEVGDAGGFHDGAASGAAGDASWELAFETDEPPLRHLPRDWMYRARLPLGGPAAARRTEVDERPNGCRFAIPGAGVTVRGEVGAPKNNFVGWVYSDPDGSEHNTVNCSIAHMELTVERDGHEPLRLSTSHGAAYELGMRDTDHGVPIQP